MFVITSCCAFNSCWFKSSLLLHLICLAVKGNPERGGGGGFTNEDIADFLNKAPADASPESLAKELVESAVKRGSTDDITVQLIRL